MSGNTNFPTSLDDNTSLQEVTDGVSGLLASHHNNLKEAAKAIEAKVGIYNTAVATSLDYRLGHPSSGHIHNGASGQGPRLSASSIDGIASITSGAGRHVIEVGDNYSWALVASAIFHPIILPRTMWLEAIEIAAFRGPSGGTTVFDVNIGATSLWYASQGLRPRLGPTAGAVYFTHGSVNYVTGVSGALVTVDLDVVGSSQAVDRPTLMLVFREQ